MYTVVDLFAGAGGLSLGFLQSGKYAVKAAFESNPAMRETYKKNHPKVDLRGDVCQADYDALRRQYGAIDVVIGGPPCQGFSNANRQKNYAVSRNNNLVREYIRAVMELRPKAFVMENVSMLRSDVHRFFLSAKDLPLAESGKIKTVTTEVYLLDRQYFFDGLADVIKDRACIRKCTWRDKDYAVLNIIYKASKNPNKLKKTLEKYWEKICEIAARNNAEQPINAIQEESRRAFSYLLQHNDHNDEAAACLRVNIERAVMYQRMLHRAAEILDNRLIVDDYSCEKNVCARIRSFGVFDYIKAMLAGDNETGYVINAQILSAADYGAPQNRNRFVVVGIRKDLASEVRLPDGAFENRQHRTVRDAIEDLSALMPYSELKADAGIPLQEEENLSDLAASLRDTNVLYNHIVTNTTAAAMERFKALGQGENFHNLDERLKSNTYTDASRTQNTIYLRLNYDTPSGTVVNVRKSMWIHPTEDRAISIREAARLQTFPDSFVFCGTKDKQYQQVGNAVPPIMAKAVAEKLAEQLEAAENAHGR
ncbi:DNA cytosine methyltransferase [Selenomonas artemidis]|uniref:DNA cytosine methyltransferase n=1 Tax=Selenomonas artemidis TaxID=671224 RepID=UPI0023F26439|nr:DNA cytosine methyltransferase [Selenomonas artemidis]